MTTILTIASGKGGVGKTSLTLNLALLLAKRGKKVLVVDGDTGLANADVQLNLRPEHDLADVLTGQVPVTQAVTPTPHGFSLLAGRSGHAGLANLTGAQLDNLFAQLLSVSHTFDLVLIDAAAGVSPITLSLCARSGKTLLVTTPDPSSFTDAYALIKLLHQGYGIANAQLVANQAGAADGRFIHQRLAIAMEKFLNLPPLPHLATIPHDRLYATAVRQHQLAAVAFPQSPAVEALRLLAQNLA